MVSPYLNRPLRSLDEVLRARDEARATEIVPSETSAAPGRDFDPAPMQEEIAALPARREAA